MPGAEKLKIKTTATPSVEHLYGKFTTGEISGLSTTNHSKDHRNCHFLFSCHNGQPFSIHKIEKFKSQKVFKVLKIRFNSAILNGVIRINHPYTQPPSTHQKTGETPTNHQTNRWKRRLEPTTTRTRNTTNQTHRTAGYGQRLLITTCQLPSKVSKNY